MEKSTNTAIIWQECLNERKLELYQLCNARAEKMASQTAAASAGQLLTPVKQQAYGVLLKIWRVSCNL